MVTSSAVVTVAAGQSIRLNVLQKTTATAKMIQGPFAIVLLSIANASTPCVLQCSTASISLEH